MTISRAFSLVCACLLLTAAAACNGPSGADAGACSGDDVSLVSEATVTVGTDPSLAPYAFERDDELVGFEVDLVREAAERMSLDIRFVTENHPALLPGLVSRRYDVVASALVGDADLREQVCTTSPYLDAGYAILVNTAEHPEIEGAEDLGGKLVGVHRATASAAWARENLDARIHAYPVPEDPLNAVTTGHLDAAVVDLPQGLYRAATHDALEVVEEVGTDRSHVLAVHPENAALRDALDEALDGLREDGAYAELYERWFGRSPPT